MTETPISTANTATNQLGVIQARIEGAISRFDGASNSAEGRKVTLVAVSKTFGIAEIEPMLLSGHRIFGENRIQEAKLKWPGLRARYPNIQLHLIGPLQTNKVKEAVGLFDVIETIDREKLAAHLSREMLAQHRRLPCFVQVNIGGEAQKAGVPPDACVALVKTCREVYDLNIIGLMCIPPANQPAGPYFAQLAGLAKLAGVEALSMGMSADFETAIAMGATHVRVGSALFGSR